VTRPPLSRRLAASLLGLVAFALCLGDAAAVPPTARPAQAPVLGRLSERTLASAEAGAEIVVSASATSGAAGILRAAGARPLSREFPTLWRLSGPGAHAALERLRRGGWLRFAHPNGRGLSTARSDAPTDPLAATQWWLSRIGADRAAAPPAGMPLTVLDTGIDVSHPEFAGRPSTYLNPQFPEEDHGTFVSSIAAAPANGQGLVGVYPQAALRSIDIGGALVRCTDAIAALGAAVAAGPSVLNMSWGFPPAACPALYDAVTVAFGAGSLPVAAAGNDGERGSLPALPAVIPHVLTVGATNSADLPSDFSSRSPTLDLAAPGEGITGAVPFSVSPTGYALYDGTSFAAPMVSAAAAWAWTARRPQLANVTQLADLLRSSARDVYTSGWDTATGFGMLDIPAALTRPPPALDPQEPNDDVDHVKAGGLFSAASPGLTRPGRGRAAINGFVDRHEDPTDVYRVWVPGGRVVVGTLRPRGGDIDLEVFRSNATTVFYRNRRAALRGALIGGSYRAGTKVERFGAVNGTRRGAYLYFALFKVRGAVWHAGYRLDVVTIKP
jgi:subtilase family protein